VNDVNGPNFDTGLDLFAHTNPAFVSAVVYWTCKGYSENAAKKAAVLSLAIPWCLVSVALVAPDRLRDALPETSARRLSNLMAEHPDWKISIADAVRLWVPSFWAGLRYGIAKGTLNLTSGRIALQQRLDSPATPTGLAVQKKSITLGKVFANEGSDAAIALALGVEVGR